MRKIILALVSSILFIIICEICLRIIYKKDFPVTWQISQSYVLDPELIYINKPNYKGSIKTDDFIEKIEINLSGFRNREILKKSKGTIRMLMVGDSFVFGHGISENKYTLPIRLEYKLNQIFPDKKIEVINAGVKGYSPDQEYRFITERSINYQPDYIIWVFNPDDIYDFFWKVPSLYDLDRQYNLKSTPAIMTWLYWRGIMSQYIPDNIKKSKITSLIANDLMMIPYLNRYLFIPESYRLKWAEKKLIKELDGAYNFAGINNFKLIVVLLPNKYVYIPIKRYTQSVWDIFSSVEIELDKIGIPFYNLVQEIPNIVHNRSTAFPHAMTNKLEENLDDEVLSIFFKKDHHLNDKGADLVADLLANKLEKLMK